MAVQDGPAHLKHPSAHAQNGCKPESEPPDGGKEPDPPSPYSLSTLLRGVERGM